MTFARTLACFWKVAPLQKQIHTVVPAQNPLSFFGPIKYFYMQRLYFFIFPHVFLFHTFIWLVAAGFGAEDDIGGTIVGPVIGTHES